MLCQARNVDLDIPADHEKKQYFIPEPISYEEYVLNLPTNDDRNSPVHSFGVFRENEVDDIKTLVTNFTSPALASALRDRVQLLSCSFITRPKQINSNSNWVALFEGI